VAATLDDLFGLASGEGTSFLPELTAGRQRR